MSRNPAEEERRNTILRDVDRAGQGLEIGPSLRPIAPKREGFNVKILDHANREDLVAKYSRRNPSNDVSAIEDVDYVWSGEKYVELIGGDKHFDWIIASHVIEHTPDLIGFLSDCEKLLKPNGVLSLAIPDKRYCFDLMRERTPLSKIIDAHLARNTVHTAGTVAEYFLNAVRLEGRISWPKGDRGGLESIHSVSEARHHSESVATHSRYFDVHAWCFTPHHFRLIVHDLISLGFLNLVIHSYVIPERQAEFYVSMKKGGPSPSTDRMELARLSLLDVSSCDCPVR